MSLPPATPACDAPAVIRARHLLAVLLVAAAWLLPAAVAAALVAVEDVAASAVAVEDGAQLPAADRARLQASARELTAAGTPVKYVVLRQRPADPQAYAAGLGRRLGYRGDILVLSPGNLAIGSRLPAATVRQAFESQRAALRRDRVAGTIAVAQGLSQARLSGVAPSNGSSGAGAGAGASPSGDGGGGLSGGVVLLLVLGVGALIVVGMLTLRRRSHRSAVATAGPETLDPLVDGLAAQIADLDDDMQVPGPLTTEARPHYDQAVLSYGEARELQWEPAPRAADVAPAGAALEAGGRAARRTRALLEGRAIAEADNEPLLEGMCAFDPKHGRATTQVTIRTPTGDRATLPACASCAAQMERGDEPRFREVRQGGRRVPYWQTGPMGMGAGGGGGFAGPVLGGALTGIILGGMLGGGEADASPGDGSWSGGGGDGGWTGGGGDFGSGGGGDPGGGGDWGGGGGGDFGGGGGDF